MHIRILTFALVLSACCVAETVSPLGSRGYTVLPEPQQVELQNGDLRFGPQWSVDIGPGISKNDVAVETLREELASRYDLHPGAGTAVRLRMQPGSVTPGRATDADRQAISSQSYRIDIDESGVTIAANAPEGLFYGAETLIQLIRPKGNGFYVPKARITDWPDLHIRHMYWDDAHHLDRLPELKRAIRQAAFFKINGFALKLEGHFQFKSAPAVTEPYALTPAEYQELTDYGLRYHVQLIPYLDAPAHIAFILKHPEYAKYRAFPDSNYEMCVVNPEAVKFITGMFQDLIDANRGGKFVYISTDEAYYIGMADSPACQEKAAALQKGTVGKLLADFIAQVANPLHKQGRTVIFWGEYPLIPSDIPSLPSHLINGEVYGPEYDPVYRKHGIRQMIYTSTQGETRMFPDYFPLANSRRLHPVGTQVDRISDGFRAISYHPARTQANVTGAVVAGWADAGLHPDTFWLGYATIMAAGWHPGTPSVQESAAAFYRLFYGDSAVNVNRIYELMSQQAQFWTDSWESGPSDARKGIWGDSDRIYDKRRPARDQKLPLPTAPGAGLKFDSLWVKENVRRVQLAAEFLSDNDELLGLLAENMRKAGHNRYTLEVFTSIAQLYRQNLVMVTDIGRMCYLLENAEKAASENRPKNAVAAVDRAIELAKQIRQQRNTAFRDAVATWYKAWFPREPQANGRKFLHELDDVKDHVPDRTVDMSYLVYRELQLPFGSWVEGIRSARNQFAAAHQLPQNASKFDWLDMSDRPVVGGIPEE